MSGGRLGSQSVVRQSAVSRRLFYNFLHDILINLELLGPMLRHLDAISDYLGTILGHLGPMLSPLGSIMGSAWRNRGG